MARPQTNSSISWLSKKYKQVLIGGLLALSALLALDYLRWHKFVMWLPSSAQSREFLEGYGLDWDSVRVQTIVTHLKYFLSGSVCASISHVGGVPIDVLKTRLQTAPERYSGIWDCAWKVIKTEGPFMLLQGLGPTAAGYCIQGGLKYGVYELLKSTAASATGAPAGSHLALSMLLILAAASEFVGSSALCPYEAARIRLVVEPTYATGLGSALARMFKETGIKGIYRALPAIYLKQVPYTMCQLATYDWVTRTLHRMLKEQAGQPNSLHLGDWETVVVAVAGASVAAVVSSLASQPGDTLLSKLNQGSGGHANAKAAKEGSRAALDDLDLELGEDIGCGPMLRLAGKLGPAGLMLGWDARLMHTGTIVLVQLLIYDAVKAAVGLPVTGHSRRLLML